MVRVLLADAVRQRVRFTVRTSSQSQVRVLNQNHMYSRHGAVRQSYWMERLWKIVEVHIHPVEFPRAEPHKLEKHKERRESLVTGEMLDVDTMA